MSTRLTFNEFGDGAGLRAAIGKSRSDIIAEVNASGIKGRGGAVGWRSRARC